MTKKRARELGLPFRGETGANNAITDVAGTTVGYATIHTGDGDLVQGEGPVRTGVTAIHPRGAEAPLMPVWAGLHALNGNGEMTGSHWIHHGGYLCGPICITNTHSVGMVHHAVTKWMIGHYDQRYREEHMWALPVVAETYDGVLNDINGQHVAEAHVFEALESATGGAIAEGNVGGGTGMICYEFKGGTGTSSRTVEIDGVTHVVGALVQANHGFRDWLTVCGVHVGDIMRDDLLFRRENGSIIVILGADLPMMPHQLQRLAQRASIGIGRHGTPGGNNSGDIFLAYSVANEMDMPETASSVWDIRAINDERFDPIYLAAVEAVEEAVVNAMLAAYDMTTLKPAGKVCRAIDGEALLAAVRGDAN